MSLNLNLLLKVLSLNKERKLAYDKVYTWPNRRVDATTSRCYDIPKNRDKVLFRLQEKGLVEIKDSKPSLTFNGKLIVEAITEQANRVCRQKYSEILLECSK
jgi:ribosomal protein S19E (S16A)